jgi:hypothetical protein
MLREQIKKHGYAIKPKVIAAEEIARLLQKIAAAGMPRSRAGIRHALKNSDVAELARDSRLLGSARLWDVLSTFGQPPSSDLNLIHRSEQRPKPPP